MPIGDWSAKEDVLKYMVCPLMSSIVLGREMRCPSNTKQLLAVPCGDEASLGSCMTQQAQVLASKAPSRGANSTQGCGCSSSLGSREKVIQHSCW